MAFEVLGSCMHPCLPIPGQCHPRLLSPSPGPSQQHLYLVPSSQDQRLRLGAPEPPGERWGWSCVPWLTGLVLAGRGSPESLIWGAGSVPLCLGLYDNCPRLSLSIRERTLHGGKVSPSCHDTPELVRAWICPWGSWLLGDFKLLPAEGVMGLQVAKFL